MRAASTVEVESLVVKGSSTIAVVDDIVVGIVAAIAAVASAVDSSS